MPAKIHFTQEKVEEIIRVYYEDELTMPEIGKKFNVLKGKLGGLLREYHVVIKNSGQTFSFHPKLWKEMAEKYLENENLSVAALAKFYGVQRGAIEIALKKQGVKIRSSGFCAKILSESDVQDLIFEYQNKTSLSILMKKYRMNKKRLHEILEKNNCPIRPKNALIKIELSDSQEKYLVTQYVENGKSLDLIATEMGFCTSFLKEKLQKLGIEIQPGFARIITRRSAASHGISGHYRGMFFRSLNEISFIVNFLERKNISYISGEANKKDGIKYLHTNGKIRNYFPDFLTENFIFEVKPKKFWKQENVSRKSEAARKFAKENDLKYRIVDYPIIFEPIFNKISNGEIIFTKTGQEKFERNFGKYLKLS